MFRVFKDIFSKLDNDEKKYLKSGLLWLLVLGFVSIILLPWILTRPYLSIADYKTTGAIGDTINGIAGPFVALLASILTFIAFYIQYKSNVQQRNHFDKTMQKQNEELEARDKFWKIERFENKYFELIKIQRDNVEVMGIGQNLGRKCFVLMIREFREILSIVKEIGKKRNIQLEDKQLLEISYLAFYYGVGPNSSRQLKESLSGYDRSFVEEVNNTLNSSQLKADVKAKRGFDYTPFEGHQSRLSHYYRHLFQTVKLVDSFNLLSDEEKYDYVKIIRAQLTTHEQGLLFLNSLTALGKPWWDRKMINGYKLVKNIPERFFDENQEIDIDSLFDDGYFDYQKKKDT